MKSARPIAEENDAFYLFTGEADICQWQHLFFRLSLYFDTQLNWPPGKAAEKSFCLSSLLSSELASSLATFYFWKWFWSCGSIHQELCWDKRLLAFKSRNSCQTAEKKNNLFFFLIIFICLPVDQEMDWGQSLFFLSTQFTPRFIHDVFPPCFVNSRQGDPLQILAALQRGNMWGG